MPYKDISDLPTSVREHLPKHAQEIYRAAYNSAWDEYAQNEERAHRVAWSAVKKNYKKDEASGQWKANDDGQDGPSSS
ncbi:MAG: ChaB family protein [Methylococcaceae bacterium]|nr:ChaB family protein [Methylococcaceae bacterium]